MDTIRIAIPADNRLVAEISDASLADAPVAGVLVLAAVAIIRATTAVDRATSEETGCAWAEKSSLAHLQGLARQTRLNPALPVFAERPVRIAAVWVAAAGSAHNGAAFPRIAEPVEAAVVVAPAGMALQTAAPSIEAAIFLRAAGHTGNPAVATMRR